jgi:hypothetical protein
MGHPPISIRSILFIRHISTCDICRLLCEGLLSHSGIAVSVIQIQCLLCSNIYKQQMSLQTLPLQRPMQEWEGSNTMSLNQLEMSVLTGFSWLRVWLQIAKFTYFTLHHYKIYIHPDDKN